MFRRDYLPRLRYRRVVAHLSGGQSIRGVLVGVYPDSLALAHGRYLSGNVEVPVDGETIVPRPQLLWVQALDPEDE